MRHIWICIIDGCLIRSGVVAPGDTMPMLMERLQRDLPHMSPDSVKVISQDGRVFDSELPFASPSAEDMKTPPADDLLAAIGVVDGHVGVKVHHGKGPEDILQSETNTFSGRVTDDMDFGIYDFNGDQLASIEDMIALLGPENVAAAPVVSEGPGGGRRRKARRQMPNRRRRSGRHPSSNAPGNAPSGGNVPPAPPPPPPSDSGSPPGS